MSCQLLYHVDPDLNMARFYRVEVLPDLFGEIVVERRWGRIGGRGQSQSASYRSTSLAEAAACELVRVKVRRGYRIASCDQPSIAWHRTLRNRAPMEHRSRVQR